MRVFISGAITGVNNYENTFAKAQIKLLEEGYTVINPAVLAKGMLPHEHFNHSEFMSVTLAMLALCDAIYMLEGWEHSKGAKMELLFAESRNKKIIFEKEPCGECAYYQVGSVCEEMCKECENNKWK